MFTKEAVEEFLKVNNNFEIDKHYNIYIFPIARMVT